MALDGKSLPEKEFVSLSRGRKAAALSRSEGQGKKSKHEWVRCKHCGYRVDKSVTDHTGGTNSGNGGYGSVTKTAGDAISDLTTDTFTDGTTTRYEGTGEAKVNKGSGCPLCGSKNFI
jgi:DNA-directed RNA polymerase subunit RPC12/RpoP